MSKGKKKAGFSWWGDWSMLWILGGFGVAYVAFVPLKAHPLHWLFSLVGAAVGYGAGLLFDVASPRLRHLARPGWRAPKGHQEKGRTGKKAR